jgi:hypothetical protein
MTFCIIKIILIFNRYEDLLKKNIQEVESILLNNRKISMRAKQFNVSFNETRSSMSYTNNYNRALLKLEINKFLV